MKRRQFLGGLGAAVMGRPFAVRAQQAGQMRHIGVLVGLAPDENGTAAIGFASNWPCRQMIIIAGRSWFNRMVGTLSPSLAKARTHLASQSPVP